MKSLVVDDETVPRTVLQRMLQTVGTCDAVACPNDALAALKDAIARHEPYDVVCLDIEMPDGSGQELLKNIRQLEALEEHEVRVLMTSSHSEPQQVKASFYNGSNGFLVKPVDFQRLLNKLREWGLVPGEQANDAAQ